MKSFHFFSGEEKSLRIAERVLTECLNDPDLAKVIKEMFCDETVTKKQLFDTAFAQGVISTLRAIEEGRLLFSSRN